MIRLTYKNDMKNNNLNKRQDTIITLLEQKNELSISQILQEILKTFKKISKITINRDLDKLLKLNYITKIGEGRAVIYKISQEYNFLKPNLSLKIPNI